jgi:hypothetical protein
MIQNTGIYSIKGNTGQHEISIESIEENDIDDIIDFSVKLFSEATGYDFPGLFFYDMTDFSISKKAVLNGKIIGVYLLNDVSVLSYGMRRCENLDSYFNLRAIQGVSLGIQKEYRGLDYGRELRDSILSLDGYDYIWGFQGKCLNNLDNWLGYGRRLVGETEDSYVTLMDLGGPDKKTA